MIERVSLPDKEVTLVGTAHVSAESVEEVATVIAEEAPDLVCVELDEQRYEALVDNDGWREMNVAEAIKDGRGQLLLLNVLLSIYQRKIADDLDLRPGEEMVAATEAAENRGIETALIDRNIQETMQDAMNTLSLLEKLKFASYGLAGLFSDEGIEADDIEDLKESSVIDALIEELGSHFPTIKHVFLEKRDSYMAEQIQDADADHVVAVVGAAHVAGIKRRLEETDFLEITPPAGRRFSPVTILKWGVPAFVIGMFAYTLFFIGLDAAADAFVFWFLINGILAAGGAIVARSHPFTWTTAFFTAPFTSLNPAMPAGLVAAYAENLFHPPSVGDVEAIASVNEYSALWENAALRLLFVFFMVNLGSAIATYIGAGYLARLLTGA